MAHFSNLVDCAGPDAPHAFDTVPLQPRRDDLDKLCPVCHGHGQWNTQIDLASFRSTRTTCQFCHGEGWVETGQDLVGVPDIVMSPQGYAMWVIRHCRPDEDSPPSKGPLAVPSI